MGNCLKRSMNDDVALLRGATEPDRRSIEREQRTDDDSEHSPVYYPSPSVSRTVVNPSEEEQVKLSKRIGLIQHLPVGRYSDFGDSGRADSHKIGNILQAAAPARECVICMLDFVDGDPVRCLPCMHTYHVGCIDDWLMRSLTCPSCLEPVDAALLTTYEAN